MKNNKQPEIRFQGFYVNWEECNLKDVSERVRGNDGRMDLPTLTISAGSGWLDQRERFSGNIAGNEQKNYTLLSKGDLSYNHGNSKLAKYGVVFVLRTFKEALVPKVYHSFKTTEKASSDFIESMFATKKPDKELAKLISSGARMDGLLNINYDEFMSINITIPKIEEQKEIAKFLRNLENTISHHQQELTALKQTKQGFLQKMFPKEGEAVPEVRFPRFTGDWEIRKVMDFSDVTMGGGTPKTSMKEYWSGEISWIQSSDLDMDKISKVVPKKKITKKGLENSAAKLVPKDSIAIVTRVGVGKMALMDYEYATSQDFLSLVNLKVNKWFGIYSLYNQLQKELKNVQGTSIKGITKSELLDKEIVIPPNLEEQQQIGVFFKNLDEVINIQQRELDVLKQTQKAFLQKMFV